MAEPGDVIVIGGGAVGSACTRALARAGARVTLLQRPDTPGEGWRASAGMIAAQIEAAADDPLLSLMLAGRSWYRQHAASLTDATGIDTGWIECGILQVAHTEATVALHKAKVAWQRQQAHRADWLDPADVAEGWPWLAPSLGGFWSPEDGAINPIGLVEAFRADAAEHGAVVVSDVALGLDRKGDRLLGVIGEERRYAAPTVVVAGGAWAGRLENLPRPISVEPIRGQMAAFDWPDGARTSVIYGERCYLLRRGEEMLVGSTMESAGFDVRVTADGLSELRRKAGTLYPALGGLSPRRTWAGLRPGTPDGRPIIGPEPRLPGLWYAVGHGRNGILLAGVTGELVAREIGGETAGEELRPVRPSRFWGW